MLFKKSIDSDTSFKHLLIEEVALEQLKFRQKTSKAEEEGWMGFPWCLSVLTLRLSAEGRKGSKALLGSIVHAATQLARDTYERRRAEMAEASKSRGQISHEDVERMAGLFAFMDSLPEVGPFPNAARMAPADRDRMIRTANEAEHRLRVCIAKGGNDPITESRINACLAMLNDLQRRELAQTTARELDAATKRPERYRFDQPNPWS